MSASPTERARTWASTMAGHPAGPAVPGLRLAHADSETATVGRVVEADANGRPHVLWTTHNAGRTWTAHAFA